jgi:hypothetical protein
LHQINKLINKGFQTLISLPWRDEAMVDTINSCNKGMSTLVGTVNVNANLNNVKIKDVNKENMNGQLKLLKLIFVEPLLGRSRYL